MTHPEEQARRFGNHATPQQALAQARKWDAGMLQCRIYRHTWQPGTARLNKQYGYWEATLFCPRCSSRCHQEISARSGTVFSSRIEYNEGYLTEPGTGRLDGDARGALRIEAMTRVFTASTMRVPEASKTPPKAKATRLGLVEQDHVLIPDNVRPITRAGKAG